MRLVFWFYGLVVCRLMLIGYVECAMGVAVGTGTGGPFFPFETGGPAESRVPRGVSAQRSCGVSRYESAVFVSLSGGPALGSRANNS